MPYP
jgi:hypothetical protein